MIELIQQNWVFFLIALAIGIAVAWWIFVVSRKTTIQKEDDETTAEEGKGTRTKRNQALIDAPPANFTADIPPATPIGMAGVGEAIAAAAEPAKVTPEATHHDNADLPTAEPVVAATPPPAATSEGDDLTRIKGVGPKLSTHLAGLGISTFAQIVAWDEAEIDRIDSQLGRFEGRIRRDNWPEQARFLAQDDTAGFEAKFGKV